MITVQVPVQRPCILSEPVNCPCPRLNRGIRIFQLFVVKQIAVEENKMRPQKVVYRSLTDRKKQLAAYHVLFVYLSVPPRCRQVDAAVSFKILQKSVPGKHECIVGAQKAHVKVVGIRVERGFQGVESIGICFVCAYGQFYVEPALRCSVTLVDSLCDPVNGLVRFNPDIDPVSRLGSGYDPYGGSSVGLIRYTVGQLLCR